MLLITSQANVNLELRTNAGVTSFSGLWPRQRNQVAKHASDWFDKKSPDWLGEQCMYFLHREVSYVYIGRFLGERGREKRKGETAGVHP